jgi:hypothetical protein
MREYRFYSVVSGTNHIKGVPAVVVCQNDTEAVEQARKLLDSLDIEVWDGARCVTRIACQPPPGSSHQAHDANATRGSGSGSNPLSGGESTEFQP